MFWHRHYSALDRLLQLFPLQGLIGERLRRLHEIHELAAFVVAGVDRRLQRVRGAPRLRTDQVARFVGRNGKEPGAKPPGGIELIRRLVHLQESLLKYIIGGRAVT